MCQARVLANMEACAPKLYAIATDVVDHQEKAIHCDHDYAEVVLNRTSSSKIESCIRLSFLLLAILAFLPSWSI